LETQIDWHNEYTERQWRNDAYARERVEARNGQMQDWHVDPVALVRCDGSGILEEFYIDAAHQK
jgi:hypothetical protein